MQDEVRVSQALPPEVQLIVDEVTAKFRQELQQIMAKDEYTCLITGKAIEPWARQFLARHRHQAERETLARMEWRDIESAPRDGSWFTAYWPVQTFEDRVQTTRWLHDDCRFVDASDFMDHIQPIAWMPLPPAPEAGQ